MRRATVLGLCSVLFAFTVPVLAQQATPQDPSASRPKQDNWQRMKDCAEQVARISKREGMRGGQKVGELTLLSIENHYSPTYERCYARLNYFNHDTQAVKNGMPHSFYELWDAFEERLLSVCTDLPSRVPYCTTTFQDEQRSMDCAVCQRFIRERMTK